MISNRLLAVALFIFALASIGSGLIRYLTMGGGENGLYFGLVTGGIALAGALLAWLGWMLAGRIVGGLGVAFVLLWFSYDMYKDLSSGAAFGAAEIRKSVVILIGLATAVILCLPIPGPANEEKAQ